MGGERDAPASWVIQNESGGWYFRWVRRTRIPARFLLQGKRGLIWVETRMPTRHFSLSGPRFGPRFFCGPDGCPSRRTWVFVCYRYIHTGSYTGKYRPRCKTFRINAIAGKASAFLRESVSVSARECQRFCVENSLARVQASAFLRGKLGVTKPKASAFMRGRRVGNKLSGFFRRWGVKQELCNERQRFCVSVESFRWA